jgi:hypothetical protein
MYVLDYAISSFARMLMVSDLPNLSSLLASLVLRVVILWRRRESIETVSLSDTTVLPSAWSIGVAIQAYKLTECSSLSYPLFVDCWLQQYVLHSYVVYSSHQIIRLITPQI